MYEMVLFLHSWLRWAALAAGVAATVTAFAMKPVSYGSERTDRFGLIFMIVLDLQLLLGLVLYFGLSPFTPAAFDNFGAAMRNPVARFWAVEHIALMLLAVVLAHLGRVLARKARTSQSKRLRLLVCFGLATIAMFAGTPWPGMSVVRPLFRV